LQPLPIDPYLDGIVSHVAKSRTLVLVAAPGAGKTTRVPPALLESAHGEAGQILLLQPRRIAARASALRIAEERGGEVGEEIGYRVRFESRCSARTRLEVMTEGVLLRRIQDDPFLDGVAAVVLDEFHERSLQSDLALALLREIREGGREDLAIVVMSATLDPAPVAEYLGDAPVVEVEGRPFPVDIEYRATNPRDPIEDAVESAIRENWDRCEGHALVFLPGAREILRTSERVEAFAAARSVDVVPLHGRLRLEEQSAALAPSSRRKIILSTNVAETSLTIDGVDLVVDSGRARVLTSDPRHGIDRLETLAISKHSADQRAGRAGRLGPGRAIRLWSRAQHAALSERESSEISRVDLSALLLELKVWGVLDAREFAWFEPPPEASLERAERLLRSLGAVRADGSLSTLGQRLAKIPSHPRIARLLVEAAERGCAEDGALLGALLEERDIVRFRAFDRREAGASAARAESSDLLLRRDLLRELEGRGANRSAAQQLDLDFGAVRAVRRVARELLRRANLEGRSSRSGSSDEDLLRSLLAAFADRVVRRRSVESERGRMVGGRGVSLARESVVRDAELFVALDVDNARRGERSEALVRLASRVERAWIEELFGERVAERAETFFDSESERVVAQVAVCFDDLPLEDPRRRPPDPVEAQSILESEVAKRAEEIVETNEDATSWLLRARFLAREMPGLELPAWTSEETAEALRPACAGRTKLDEVRRADIVGLLRGSLSYDLVQAIEKHAPERFEVPSGSQIRLVYEDGRPPVLAVRLQEIFGMNETPRVAGGKVPLLVHILGPNYRPVQVTQDLESFWDSTYFQVRKDLRGRYPKHAWPDDPRSAEPERRPRRKRPES